MFYCAFFAVAESAAAILDGPADFFAPPATLTKNETIEGGMPALHCVNQHKYKSHRMEKDNTRIATHTVIMSANS